MTALRALVRSTGLVCDYCSQKTRHNISRILFYQIANTAQFELQSWNFKIVCWACTPQFFKLIMDSSIQVFLDGIQYCMDTMLILSKACLSLFQGSNPSSLLLCVDVTHINHYVNAKELLNPKQENAVHTDLSLIAKCWAHQAVMGKKQLLLNPLLN